MTERKRLHRYLPLVLEATAAADILDAARAYLAAWPEPSIERLKSVDGGWSPFDRRQRPIAVAEAEELRCIRDAVHAHCIALRGARAAVSEELAELEAFFFVANERIHALRTAQRHRVAPPRLAT